MSSADSSPHAMRILILRTSDSSRPAALWLRARLIERTAASRVPVRFDVVRGPGSSVPLFEHLAEADAALVLVDQNAATAGLFEAGLILGVLGVSRTLIAFGDSAPIIRPMNLGVQSEGGLNMIQIAGLGQLGESGSRVEIEATWFGLLIDCVERMAEEWYELRVNDDPREKSVPLTVRISPTDARFLAEFGAHGAETPSDKMRLLLRMARRTEIGPPEEELRFSIRPGSATAAEVLLLLSKLSRVHEAIGGGALRFRVNP